MTIHKINWDTLTPYDIEVRVATVKNGKATLLLYQDGRCTARNLDKMFGSFGWQIEYEVVGDQIYGKLSIYDEEKNQWVCKMDTGDKSNISEDKGQSSDILKRCAVRWGFATELYTAPRIIIDDDGYGNTGYKVGDIAYNSEREICYLTIVNKFGKKVFEWNNEGGEVRIEQPKTQPTSTEVKKDNPVSNQDALKAFCTMTKTPDNEKNLLRFYNYYLPKCDSWKGVMNFMQLWDRWNSKPQAN
jgi:hypothetical protein